MQQLSNYLFNKHILTDEKNLLVHQLCKLKVVELQVLKPNQEQLHLLQYLIAKNYCKYSPTHLTLQLNLNMVLVYQRIFKIKSFCQQYLHKEFYEFFQKFVEKEFLPVQFSDRKVGNIHGLQQKKPEPKGKGKKKKEEPQKMQEEEPVSQYSRLLFEYSPSQKEGESDYMINIDELTLYLKWQQVEINLGKERSQDLKKQFGSTKKDLFLELLSASRQNNSKSQIAKKVLLKMRQEKIEEYIVQLFRKYDEEGGEQLSVNCLLLFNIIKRNPLANQKQLINFSLLSLVTMRKSLNLLVQQGFIHFYPQGSRSMVYKIRQYCQIEQLFIDRTAQSILNLHLLMNSQNHLAKDQRLKLECMIWDLDNILLLFSQ